MEMPMKKAISLSLIFFLTLTFPVLVPQMFAADNPSTELEERRKAVGEMMEAATVGIVVDSMEWQSLRQIARGLFSELIGSTTELDDGFYIFTYTNGGVDAMAVIREVEDEDMYVVIFVPGEWNGHGVEQILTV